MKSLLILSLSLVLPSILAAEPETSTPAKTQHRAAYTSSPVVVDGVLDEAIWQNAKTYPFNVAWRKDSPPLPLSEGATAKLAWDENYLYVGALIQDVDIVAEADSDNAHHYSTGDVLEVFLKPPGKKWYWEMYATPHAKRTVFFFPSRGRVFLPSSVDTTVDLKVAARIDGTLNQWKDKDRHWSVEMAIPLSSLKAHGDKIAPDALPWQMLIARYNYSAQHEVSGGELSSTLPQWKNANFHNYDQWGELILEK